MSENLTIVEDSGYLKVQQAADFLQVPKSSIYQWSMRKLFSVYKLGGGKLSRYKKADLINFVEHGSNA